MRILLLDLDSTNPEHLGCYGYHRETSPNIDRIAKDGVRFANYYTSDAPCFPSRTAFMTGQFGIHNGVVGHGGTAGDPRHEGESREFQDRLATESLPAFLRSQGMKTTLISPFAERHSAWSFYAGFNEMYNTGQTGNELALDVTSVAHSWIEQNAKQDNWFLYVNYWDPHTPYRTPLEYGNPFADDPLPDGITTELLEQHKKKVGPHSVLDINMYDNRTDPNYPRQPGEIKDMSGMRRMIDGYDTGIRYMDEHIGHLFAALEKEGVMEDLMIIITADHGENMGHLGIYGEHGTADQGTCHIPMIIRYPSGKKGHVDEGFHYHLDLAPTLADLFGASPAPSWDGQSYKEVLTDGADQGRNYVVISQGAHVCQRSVRFGSWLYMRTYHDGYHLFDKEMLYNLEKDSLEQHNLAAEHPELCKEGAYRLMEWHDQMMLSMPYDVDPMWTVMREGGPYHAKDNLQRYVRRLEESERGFAVEELKRRHPEEFRKGGQ